MKRSRFCNQKGERLPLNAVFNAPYSFCQTINRKFFNQYPELPWIPFSVIQELKRLIQPGWEIVEIGSGLSTLWYAKRCKKIISVEASQDWFNFLSKQLLDKKINNVELRFEWIADKMADFSEFDDESLDLVIIDGGPREDCTINALPKIKKGGYLYLDNSDSIELCGNATEILLEWVNHNRHYYSFHTDFVPGNFFVNQGLLVQKPFID